MIHVHTNFSKLCPLLNRNDTEHVVMPQSLNTIHHRMQTLKALVKGDHAAYCNTGLYTLKFHILHYVIEYLGRSGCLELMSISLYERDSIYINRAYRSTSLCRMSLLEMTLRAVDVTIRSRR